MTKTWVQKAKREHVLKEIKRLKFSAEDEAKAVVRGKILEDVVAIWNAGGFRCGMKFGEFTLKAMFILLKVVPDGTPPPDSKEDVEVFD